MLGFVAVAPASIHGEVVFLKDGSNFKGSLVKLVSDTLYFKTSFGAEIRIPRNKILRVDFADSLPSWSATGMPSPPPSMPEAPGTLHVEFDEVKVLSTISVHRDRDREGHERENTIEFVLIVDGRTVYTAADSTTDKVIKKGAEVMIRNRKEPESIKVGLTPGLHRVTVILANRRGGKYRDRLENGGLNKRVSADNVLILSGETRHFTVGLKRKKFGLSRSQLYVLP